MDLYEVRPGAESYGHEIGILLVDCFTPFIPGDVGNASTYSYPVLYHTVQGCSLERLINLGDETLTDTVVKAAKFLEQRGVRGITSDCGFMIRFQDAVARAVKIPVFLSSMTQLPMVGATLGWSRPVGIITANAKRMTPELLTIATAGSNVKFVVAGLEDKPAFRAPILDETGPLDPQKIESEIVEVAIELLRKNPEIGAILLECSNMPPYAHAVQQATGLPVFDFTTLINFMVSGNHRKKFDGIF
ncbi:MAG: aspartate/glutamate racemase family protein [Desulfuromusa sp.]|nr:aspartate/glutamate racemase family protein [Desulfuromusa sp.]